MAKNTAQQTDRADGFSGWVTKLVHLHRAGLTRIVRREGLRAEDALDCVQEAFLSFLNLPQARLLVDLPEDSARLLAILARNIARNRRRRHDYARAHISDAETIEAIASDTAPTDEIIAAAERHALILGCMATLTAVQAAIVRLRLVDDIAGEDVARQLGLSTAHVAVLLFRARQQLKHCAADSPPVPPQRRTARTAGAKGSQKSTPSNRARIIRSRRR